MTRSAISCGPPHQAEPRKRFRHRSGGTAGESAGGWHFEPVGSDASLLGGPVRTGTVVRGPAGSEDCTSNGSGNWSDRSRRLAVPPIIAGTTHWSASTRI